jgi:hypothetical protein
VNDTAQSANGGPRFFRDHWQIDLLCLLPEFAALACSRNCADTDSRLKEST